MPAGKNARRQALLRSQRSYYLQKQTSELALCHGQVRPSEVFASVNSETKSLFRLLQENKRFEILGAIAEQFNALYDEMQGVEVAKVTTAIPMTAELEAKVLDKIALISDKKITIENLVDPAIIGGFILRIGDKQYNASVANRLQELKREFSN